MTGSQGMAILLNGWILPIGGVALGFGKGLCLQPGQQACFYSNKINTHELNDPNLSVQVLARQFIGSPINCMSDSMSGGIMDSYCWLHSTYSVNGRFGFNRSSHLGIHKQTNVGWSLDSLAHSGASHSHTMYVISSAVKHCNSKLTSLLPARNTLHAIIQPHNPSSMVWLLLLLETVFVCLLIFCEQTVQNGVLPSFKCTVCTVCGCA